MRVKCLCNTGIGFSEYTQMHMGCSINTKLPLEVGDIYVVYGQIIFKGILQFLIKGKYEDYPSWYPAEIFEVIDNRLYFDWFFQYYRNEEVSALWGFKELIFDEQYLDKLMNREKEALKIFLERKKEIDEWIEW